MNKTLSAMLLTAAAMILSASPAEARRTENIGLDKYDFMYAGESKNLRVFKVKGGEIVWEYDAPLDKGEISDAILLNNGNVLIAHRFGVMEISADKEIVWRYDVDESSEIHTLQPIGTDHVVFIQNGEPLKAVIMEVPSTKIVSEFVIPYKQPANVHGQVRNARLTPQGTLLLAHMQNKEIYEFDQNGNILNRWDVPQAWAVEPLDNGNMLISGYNLVQEMTRDGEVVWEYKWSTSDQYPSVSVQKAVRLPNGNTLISNWHNEWRGTVDLNDAPVQYIEVTPEKEIVWELSAWREPANLGASTTIQMLDTPVDPTALHFGTFGAKTCCDDKPCCGATHASCCGNDK